MSAEADSFPSRLGRYALKLRLASGGMATVYLAQMTGGQAFAKAVAIKVIKVQLQDEPAALRMFMDEARITAAINHPNVCQVFDFGFDAGVHYLVMEYLVGEPLNRVGQRLRRAPKSPTDRERQVQMVCRIIADAAEGLHSAHELTGSDGRSLDIVHRDVSPQNIFVTYSGATKVVDFGIAKARQRLEHTEPGMFKGKSGYSSPEQVSAEPVDRRADVWALGVCLWEFVTGRKLFAGEDFVESVESVRRQPIAPPSSVVPWADEALDEVVLGALQRDVTKRYATARDLSRALRAYLASRQVSIEPPEVAEWLRELFPGDAERRVAAGQFAMTLPEAAPVQEVPREHSVTDLEPVRAGPLHAKPVRASPLRLDPILLEPKRVQPPPAVPSSAGRQLLALGLVVAAVGLAWYAIGRASSPVDDEPRRASPPEPVVATGPTAAAAVEPGAIDLPAAPDGGGFGSPDASLPAIESRQDGGDATDGAAQGALAFDAPVDGGAGASGAIDAGEVGDPEPHVDGPVGPRLPGAQRKGVDAGAKAPRVRPSPQAKVKTIPAPLPAAPSSSAPGRDSRPDTGRVLFRSTGPVYEVFVDGVRRGSTPTALDLPAGQHLLEFKSPNAPLVRPQHIDVRPLREYEINVE